MISTIEQPGYVLCMVSPLAPGYILVLTAKFISVAAIPTAKFCLETFWLSVLLLKIA